MTRTCLAALALIPLVAALPACRRSDAANQSQAAPMRTPDRLMPRHPDQRERVDTTGAERVTCREQIDSIPCRP